MSDAIETRQAKGGDLVRRHRVSTRLWHWVNAAALLVLLMSGLMIFNAHPRLYWGEYGANPDHAWLEIGATRRGEGAVRIGSAMIRTTGVLGVFTDGEGRQQARAFPGWATIPSHYSLADARLWHLAVAWVLAPGLLAYLLWSLGNGHLRRDIHIARAEWRPAHVWRALRDHARLRWPRGADALRYNVLQKMAYAAVLFGLLPLAIVTGMAMAPGIDAGIVPVTALFGGRQSARSIHFLCAFGLAGFTLIHLVMVVMAGPLNELRSMITGWFCLPQEPGA